MLIYLIRHGETDWNKENRIQGSLDIPLNENGLKQAERIAARLSRIPFSAVYSSDLTRARQTAAALIGKSGMSVTESQALREINFGIWEGKVFEEILPAYIEHLSVQGTDSAHVPLPGGESYEDVRQRVVSEVTKIIGRYGNTDTLAFFSHGVAIKVLLCHMLGLSLENRHSFELDNGGISIASYFNDKKNFKVKAINDTAHFDERFVFEA